MKNLFKFVFVLGMLFSSFAFSQYQNMGQVHNELLDHMLKNHDIKTFSTLDSYIGLEYDYLSKKYPELSTYDKKEFVSLVLLQLNSNQLEKLDYKKTVELVLRKAKDENQISSKFYSDITAILYDEATNGENIEEKIANVETSNKLELQAIQNFADVANSSKGYWKGRNWGVWAADTWGSFIGGMAIGAATGFNPILGFIGGVVVGELMSAAVANTPKG